MSNPKGYELEGYDRFFRGHGYLGTREGKRNEMIFDTLQETKKQNLLLENSNMQISDIVRSNREMIEAQEDAQRGSMYLQEQMTEKFNDFTGSIDGFREDFRAVAMQQYEMSAERNDILAEIEKYTKNQVQVTHNQTKQLRGMANGPLFADTGIKNDFLTLIALQQRGVLNPKIKNLLKDNKAFKLGNDINVIQDHIKCLQARIRNTEKDPKKRNNPDYIEYVNTTKKDLESYQNKLSEKKLEISKLAPNEKLAFEALYEGRKLPLDASSLPTLRQLGANYSLDPAFHRELMKRDPESRQGIEGVNISVIETNEILKQGFGAVISQLDGYSNGICNELQLNRETIIESTQFLAETFTAGMTTLDSNMRHGFNALQSTMQNEGQMTRDTVVGVGQVLDNRMQAEGQMTRDTVIQSTQILGNIIQNGVSVLSGEITTGFNNTNKNLQKISEAFATGLQTVDSHIRDGFFAVQEQISQDGSANREAILKSAEYVSKIFITGLNAVQKNLEEGFKTLEKRAEYANYLSSILVQEAMKSNQLLTNIDQDLVVLNQNILAGQAQQMLQHGELLDALSKYDQNANIRQQESQHQLMRKNVLVWINDGIQPVREGVEKISHELATKETWFLNKYNAAEQCRINGFLDDAIAIYNAIIAPAACPQHYPSHIALVDCYILKGDFEKAIKSTRLAQACARTRNKISLIEESYIIEFGIKYSQITNETDEIKKQKMYMELIRFFEPLKLSNEISNTAKLFYFGVLYKMGMKAEALVGLAEIIKTDKFSIFDLSKISPLADFFNGDHLDFFKKEILESNAKFPSEVYMYMFRLYESANDKDRMKLALKKAVDKRPSACMEAKIFNSPMVKEFLIEDLKEFLIANKDNNKYKGNDLIAFYYLVKRFDLPFLIEIREKAVNEINMNQSLKGVNSLFSLSIILGEDFEHYYKSLYSKKYFSN